MKEQTIQVVTREVYYSQQQTFAVRVPEISQVEVTNACNFFCDFCPRDEPGYKRSDSYMSVDLARTIATRDLSGSHFVEFQLSGEPTLHKQLTEIIECFAGKVLTGLSTNGSSMHGARIMQGLLMLDYLTISIDSVEEYEKVRPGGKWDRLVSNIDALLAQKGSKKFPHIDLQLIEFPGFQRQKDLLFDLAQQRGWTDHVKIRTVPDCFLSVTREHKEIRKKDLCLNPWLSVSVHSDGDVVPCCFGFGKQIVYGNLNEQSLEEIWNTSPEVRRMRESHLTGIMPSLCETCYQRSPVLLHWDLYKGAVNERVLEANATARGEGHV